MFSNGQRVLCTYYNEKATIVPNPESKSWKYGDDEFYISYDRNGTRLELSNCTVMLGPEWMTVDHLKPLID